MCISGEVICAGLKHKGCIWKVNKPMNNLIGSFLRSFLFSESGAMFKICSVSLAIGIITFFWYRPYMQNAEKICPYTHDDHRQQLHIQDGDG